MPFNGIYFAVDGTKKFWLKNIHQWANNYVSYLEWDLANQMGLAGELEE